MAHAYRTARRVGRMPAAASAHLQRCALRSPCLPPGVGPWPGLGCSGLRRAQVGLNACSMTMCGLMLESILESASEFVSVAEEARFLQRCRLFACGCGLYPVPPLPPGQGRACAASVQPLRAVRWGRVPRCMSGGASGTVMGAADGTPNPIRCISSIRPQLPSHRCAHALGPFRDCLAWPQHVLGGPPRLPVP